MTDYKARLQYWKQALDKLYAAYIALLEGGVASYTIDDRTLTRLDLSVLQSQITEAERMVDALEQQVAGKKPRRAFGIVPRDW